MEEEKEKKEMKGKEIKRICRKKKKKEEKSIPDNLKIFFSSFGRQLIHLNTAKTYLLPLLLKMFEICSEKSYTTSFR